MPRISDATRLLTETLSGLKTTFASLSKQSAAAAKSSSAVLFGMIGGFVGLGATYALSLALPISFGIVSVILTGIGIVGGVLMFRGKSRISAENKLDVLRFEREALLAEYKALPRNSPVEAREAIWGAQLQLLHLTVQEATQLGSHSRSAVSEQAHLRLPR